MALAVLVEEAGDRRPEEEEHLVALARRSGEVHEVAGEQAVRVAFLPGRARLAQQPNLLRGKRQHAGCMARGPQRARVGVGMVGEVGDDERLRGGFRLPGSPRSSRRLRRLVRFRGRAMRPARLRGSSISSRNASRRVTSPASPRCSSNSKTSDGRPSSIGARSICVKASGPQPKFETRTGKRRSSRWQ